MSFFFFWSKKDNFIEEHDYTHRERKLSITRENIASAPRDKPKTTENITGTKKTKKEVKLHLHLPLLGLGI